MKRYAITCLKSTIRGWKDGTCIFCNSEVGTKMKQPLNGYIKRLKSAQIVYQTDDKTEYENELMLWLL